MSVTKVYLLSVQLNKDNAHTIYFTSASAQYDYFIDKKKKEYTDFTFQRHENTIRVPEHIDSLLAAGCNYVMYQNPQSYPGKWFYAFITGMEYANGNATRVSIKTDCLQTWMFDITIKPSFVEREHAKTDAVGDHTLDEALELGEYVCNLHSMSEYAGDSMSIVIGVTKKPNGDNVNGLLYNNIYSGLRYYSFDPNNQDAINEFLRNYDGEGMGDAVVCMFIAPRWLAPVREDHIVTGSNITDDYYINASGEVKGVQKALTAGNLDGYTPRNKKLLSFPFRYLLVANNSGASVPFKYELFKNEGAVITPRFVIEGVLTPGCSVRMVPLYYNGIYRNDECGVNMGKFPALNWTSDVYTNWLTQNGVNIAINLVAGAGQIVAGAAIGATTAAASGGAGLAVGGSQIVSGVSQITNTLTQIHQQSFSPPQAKGNLNSGDVVTATYRNDFHFYDMTVKAEVAKVIDGYFDMFGYKCGRVKIPEKAHRAKWWYTKTIDVNITGAIPQDDLQTIKDCYNRGITFWSPHADFLDYSYDNGIV